MRYTGFGFRNFKGIEDLYLPLTEDGVTTLIGLNESGKTTILEAIFCFSYGAENLDAIDPSMAHLREPERWVPISKRGNFNDTIEIRAEVQLSENDLRTFTAHMRQTFDMRVTNFPSTLEITEQYQFENSRYVRTTRQWALHLEGTIGRQTTPRNFSAEKKEWRGAVAYFKTNLPRIWYFPNFLFELPERFMLEDLPAVSAGEEADRNSFYQLTFERILGQIGNGADLGTHVVERVKSADRTDQRNLQALLLEMARDITARVFDGWNRIFGRAPAAQEVQIDADQDDDGDVFLELKIKGPDGYYDLSERSLGFRWFFMFLLMTSYRGLSAEGKGVVFLLDEPASNLHSSAQAQLLKSFETLAQNCQLIYTTHSHHMINVKWLDSAFVVKNEALGDLSLEDYLSVSTAAKTSISAKHYRRFVAENPSNTSYFQPVLDLLEYRPSDLEAVPRVVLVEGKSDFYLLKYAIDVLGAAPRLRLVPGGGAGSLDPLIRLHVGWGQSFIVLLDDDSEGRKQKARYEKEFGPLLRDRCVILAEVCEGADVKEAEDLLDGDDREAIIAAVFTEDAQRPTAKKALLQATLELFGRSERVSLSDDSKARVNGLLAALESRLEAQSGNT